MARVTISPRAAKELESLPKPIHVRMIGILERLHNWPQVSGARHLRGELSGHYRIRTGDYRLQFRIEGQVVIVEKIGHREGFYED